MQINIDELSKRIDESINKGVRNRNKILDYVFKDNKQIMTILELCRNHKNESDIVIELKMPIEEVRKNIKYIDDVSKIIDSNITYINSRAFYKNKALRENLPHGTEKELEESITRLRREEIYRKDYARKYLNNFFINYHQNKATGKIDKKELLICIEKAKKMIEYLNYQTSYVLRLVDLYDDLEDYKTAESILKKINQKQLSETERKNYLRLKDKTKITRNKKMIEKLHDMGYTPKQILDLCEKETSEYRAPYLDLKFISDVLKNKFKKERMKRKENDEPEL